jgi:Ca2+-binding EF-hand superfamily protein
MSDTAQRLHQNATPANGAPDGCSLAAAIPPVRSIMSHESHEMRKLQTSTSMYMPQGASPTERTSSDGSAGFASTPGSGSAGGLGTPGSGSAGGLGSPGGRLAQLRPIRKKLTRGETRTSFMDRSLDSKGDRDGAPTKTFRLMSDTNMSALKLFKTLDVDNSGCLDLDEVAKLAELLEVSMPKSGVRRSFEEMDEDGDGEVTFEEFAIWWQNVKENDRRKVRRMVRNAFHKLDRNGDGTIHKHEFKALMNAKMRKVMKLLGGPFDLEKDWALMHRAYVERGGQLDDHLPVSFSLFESWWKNRNGIDDGEVPVIPEAMALRINDAVRTLDTPFCNAVSACCLPPCPLPPAPCPLPPSRIIQPTLPTKCPRPSGIRLCLHMCAVSPHENRRRFVALRAPTTSARSLPYR